jgi:hypothetical protein
VKHKIVRAGGARADIGEREYFGPVGLRDVGRGRQTALAVDEAIVHEAVSIGGVVEPEFVAHLVHHGGEQVEMTGRGAGRSGGHVGAGRVLGKRELEIVRWRRIDEPAMAGGIGIDDDVAGGICGNGTGTQKSTTVIFR